MNPTRKRKYFLQMKIELEWGKMFNSRKIVIFLIRINPIRTIFEVKTLFKDYKVVVLIM